MKRRPGVAWNTGHGWTAWHRPIAPALVKCGKTVPDKTRVSHTRDAFGELCAVCFPPEPVENARHDRADVLDPTALAGALI